MSNTQNFYQGCYGSKVKPSEAKNWILRNILENISRKETGIPRVTLNCWGIPGCGKTSIVKQLSDEEVLFKGEKKKIQVVDVPLAQIEEMGDILGFPVEEILLTKGEEMKWIKAVDAVIQNYLSNGWNLTDNKRTSYAPPSWVPTESCPGVILFDDGNRASQRIMKGLMQLVQDYRTISWEIPEGWTICFTGNPDNRYNQVTSMDSAQLTRMKHITLECNAKEWAIWAEGAGIDKRGVNFVLRYPEMMIGNERTNPRSLTEFFYSLKLYSNLSEKEQFDSCYIDANASLDEETVSVLMTFLTRDVELVISPEMILNGDEEVPAKIKQLMKDNRIDIVSVTLDRLCAYLQSDDYVFSENHPDKFRQLVTMKEIPKDLIYASLSDLANSKWKYIRKFIAGQEIMDMVLDMYKME